MHIKASKLTVVALLAMALAGCDPTMSPEVMAKEDACRHSTSSWVVWANCVNAVENKYNLAGGDLNQVLQAARVAYAEKVDHGQMCPQPTPILNLAKMNSNLQSEHERRNAAAAAAAAAGSINNAGDLQHQRQLWLHQYDLLLRESASRWPFSDRPLGVDQDPMTANSRHVTYCIDDGSMPTTWQTLRAKLTMLLTRRKTFSNNQPRIGRRARKP